MTMEANLTKILIVEDSEPVRSNICQILESAEYEVVQADNGLEALEKIKQEKPALIIADIMMPEMDGLTLNETLKSQEHTENIPLIFLTACSTHDDIRRGMREGADDYLIKPFKAKDLLDAVAVKLKKTQAAEKRMNVLRENISSWLPHEFRTPLVSLLGYSQMLDEYVEKDDETELMVAGIKTSAGRLHKVIEKFISYSNVNVTASDPDVINKLRKDKTMFPADIIENTSVDTAIEHGRAEDLKLDLKNMSVRINEDNLRIVINELVDNAFKFSGNGDSVKVKAGNLNGAYVIQISDSGEGMEDHEISSLGTFIQHKRQNERYSGNGLGLTIVKKLLDIHGAEIFYESSPAVGTTVRLTLLPV